MGLHDGRGSRQRGRQADYLSRQWLANLAAGVNLSIFYDWHDDGNNTQRTRAPLRNRPVQLGAEALFLAAQKADPIASRLHLPPSPEGPFALTIRKLLFQKANEPDGLIAGRVVGQAPRQPSRSKRHIIVRLGPDDFDAAPLRRLASIQIPPWTARRESKDIPTTLELTVVNT